jgi:hypothetical protein
MKAGSGLVHHPLGVCRVSCNICQLNCDFGNFQLKTKTRRRVRSCGLSAISVPVFVTAIIPLSSMSARELAWWRIGSATPRACFRVHVSCIFLFIIPARDYLPSAAADPACLLQRRKSHTLVADSNMADSLYCSLTGGLQGNERV